MSITNFIEEYLFGCHEPIGNGQENYDCFLSNWGRKGLTMKDGYEITPDDVQKYIDYANRIEEDENDN